MSGRGRGRSRGGGGGGDWQRYDSRLAPPLGRGRGRGRGAPLFEHDAGFRGRGRGGSSADEARWPRRDDKDYRQRERSRSPEKNDDQRKTRFDQQKPAVKRKHSGSNNDHDEARKNRMARLRAENEEEDFKIQQALESQEPQDAAAAPQLQQGFRQVDETELEGLDEEEQMKLLMGFEGFGSTKNSKVEDNHSSSARGAAAKHKARKYRQYMNRKNGFNRPLDKMD